MRTINRFVGAGLLLAVIIAAGSAVATAQNPCEDDAERIAELDTVIRENYTKNSTLKKAIDAGKEYLEKYSNCPATKDFAAWLKGQVPEWETDYALYLKEKKATELNDKYVGGLNTRNFDNVYSAGRELIAEYPNESLNVVIPMASIGLYESYSKNYKFNEDALRYARLAIQKMDSGEKSIGNAYGIGQYAYGNKDDAYSEMNYVIAYILFHVKNDKKGALPYYFEVAQRPGRNQAEPRVYTSIGTYYLEHVDSLGKEIAQMIAERSADDPDDVRTEKEAKIDAKIALQKGYQERALDALGRGHKLAKEDTAANKQLKAQIYNALQGLYESRFEKKDGLDRWLATALAKPMPNPTSEVAPVEDAEQATGSSAAAPAPAPAAKPAANGRTARVTRP
jgi:hypothetical protein